MATHDETIAIWLLSLLLSLLGWRRGVSSLNAPVASHRIAPDALSNIVMAISLSCIAIASGRSTPGWAGVWQTREVSLAASRQREVSTHVLRARLPVLFEATGASFTGEFIIETHVRAQSG